MKNKEDVVDNKTQVAEYFIDNTSCKLKNERKHPARRLQRVSLTEKRFLDDAVHAATKVKGKKLTSEEGRKVLCIAREQIRSQRRAEEIKKKETKNVMQ